MPKYMSKKMRRFDFGFSIFGCIEIYVATGFFFVWGQIILELSND